MCVHSRVGRHVEEQILELCPAIFFAHDYAGMCISGGKTLHDPDPHPCGRTLGPGCLAHYYPHRCGGFDPRTMFRDYVRNTRELQDLRRYRAVVSNSNYLRSEYFRHGLDAGRLKVVPPFVSKTVSRAPTPRDSDSTGSVRLGFVGRLEKQKGVAILIESLPSVARILSRPITLTIAGDGALSEKLRRAAVAIAIPNKIDVRFAGWLDDDALDNLYSNLDALVVPSVWPEPFGMVGIEAAAHGVPAVAFDVGGISQWLNDGENGHLADGASPNSNALAQAIVRCVAEREHHHRLCEGALSVAASYSGENHLRALTDVFDLVSSPHLVKAG